jgi:cell wall-associated NlpC family hydrolase
MMRRRVVITTIATAITLITLLTPTLAVASPSAEGGSQIALARSTTATGTAVVAVAQSCLGVPYVYGGASTSGFDCSGLTMYCYAQVGVALPHNAAAQQAAGIPVKRADLQPGDLVFSGSSAYHVGIYVGGGTMIHAPHTGTCVRYDALPSDYGGACRYFAPPRTGDAAARRALRQLCLPYAEGGADPGAGFDAAGLVRYVFLRCGKRLPDTLVGQFRRGRAVEWDALKPGDVVFCGRPLKRAGVYVGDQRMATVSEKAGAVDVRPISQMAFRGARRYLTAPPGATPTGRYVTIVACRYLDVPYLYGGATPDGFDCSGLTMYVLGKFGLTLDHDASAQAADARGTAVAADDLRRGDLVFFGEPAHHVGIYVGNGRMIDAPSTGGVVSIRAVSDDFSSARRFFTAEY